MSSEECRYCKAKCVWATFLASSRRRLVNPHPVDNGNIALTSTRFGLTAEVVPEGQRSKHAELYELHFATCPHAKTARRPSRRSDYR